MRTVHVSLFVLVFCWLVILFLVAGYFLGWLGTGNQFEQWYGQEVEFEGVIAAEPYQSGSQIVTILPDGAKQYLRASFYFPIYAHRGDRVWVRGRVEQPENFSGFNYIGYLQRHNTFAVLKQPQVIVIAPAGRSVYKFFRDVRGFVILRLSQSLEQPASSLALGMLIGYRQTLPGDIEQSFNKAGLTHILAVSGFNMTIVANAFGMLAWIIGRRKADILAVFGVIAFTLLTGFTAAVIRAAIMAIIWLVARAIGRITYSYLALLLAGTLMLIHNPLLLFYDVGFQLSISATIGVLAAHQLRVKIGREDYWSELLWPTFGAIVLTAPIVAYHFNTLSIIAPLANALVLPLVPILMLLGVLSLVPIIDWLCVPLLQILINIEVAVVKFLAAWQYSSIPWFPDWPMIVIYYLVLGFFWLIFKPKPQASLLPGTISYVKLKKIII